MRPFMGTKHVVILSTACKGMNVVLSQNCILWDLEDKFLPCGTKNGFPLQKLLSREIFSKWTVYVCCSEDVSYYWNNNSLIAYRPDSLYNDMLWRGWLQFYFLQPSKTLFLNKYFPIIGSLQKHMQSWRCYTFIQKQALTVQVWHVHVQDLFLGVYMKAFSIWMPSMWL